MKTGLLNRSFRWWLLIVACCVPMRPGYAMRHSAEGEQLPLGYSRYGGTRSASTALFETVSAYVDSTALTELAAGLEHDPEKMFQYVKDEVEYDAYWGSMKGDVRTLLDGRGNGADQARLLAALWDTCGHEYRFVRGNVQLDAMNVKRFLGCETIAGVSNLLDAAYIPWTNTTAYNVDHIWLQDKNAAGTWQNRTPALCAKHIYAGWNPSDVVNAAAFSDTALTAAASCSTNEYGGVLNMDTDALYSYLDGCASTLAAVLDDHNDIYAFEMFRGVRQDNTQPLYSTLAVTDTYNSFPEELEHRVTFTFVGETNQPFHVTMASIASSRLSITFNEQEVDALKMEADTKTVKLESAVLPEQLISPAFLPGPAEEPVETAEKQTVTSRDPWSKRNSALQSVLMLLLFAPEPEPEPEPLPLELDADDFGYQMWGVTTTNWLQLTGSAITNIVVTNVVISGPNADAFSVDISVPCYFHGDVNGYVPVEVIAPTGVRSLTAELAIYYTVNNEPYVSRVPLTAVGGPTAPFINFWIEDELVTSTRASTNGNKLLIGIEHPYPGADQSVTYPLAWYSSYAYSILCSFNADPECGYLKARQKKQEQMRAEGLTYADRRMKTESLHVMGHSWMAETALSEMFQNRLLGARNVMHHRFGVMAQEQGYYVDVKAQVVSVVPDTCSAAEASRSFDLGGMIGSAMEHGIIEQLQGTNNPATSTIRILEQANQQGVPVYCSGCGQCRTGASTAHELSI